MFRNVMVYLGLGPDEEYDDGYLSDDAVDPASSATPGAPAVPGGSDVHATGYSHTPRPSGSASGGWADPTPYVAPPAPESASAVGSVRPLRAVGSGAGAGAGETSAVTSSYGTSDDDGAVTVRPLNRSAEATGEVSGVRAVQARSGKPKSLAPQSFGDAKILADEFKKSVPVIMLLQDLDRDLARRLIDFASGVCYSLSGTMEKLASGVFLLIPRGVDVSAEDRRRIEERGFDR